VGNDERIETIFSGHIGVLLLAVAKYTEAASATKAQTRQKRFGRLIFEFDGTAEGLQRTN